MKIVSCVAIAAVLLLGVSSCWALDDTATQTFGATVNEIAVIDASGGVGPMAIDAPDIGGEEPETASSKSAYIQYTSIVPESAPGVLKTRQIEAQISNGEMPTGTTLTLHAVVKVGSPGVGVIGSRIGVDEKDLGIKVGGLYPSQAIVGGITTGWTGADPPNGGAGARLFYTFKVYDWNTVRVAASRTITVTYTLKDPV